MTSSPTSPAELSVLNGCILWGSHVIVPPQGRQVVLEELHETHPGTSRMKALARSYLWWLQMDSEIKTCVKNREYRLLHHPFTNAMATGAVEPAALRLCRSTHGTHVPSNQR